MSEDQIQYRPIGKPQMEYLCLDRAIDNILMVPTKVVKSLVYSIKFILCKSFKVFLDYIESFF